MLNVTFKLIMLNVVLMSVVPPKKERDRQTDEEREYSEKMESYKEVKREGIECGISPGC